MDLNGDGVMGVLTDHNDWAALTLPFVRSSSGDLFQKSSRLAAARMAAKVPATGATVPNPLINDRGPTLVSCGPEPIGPYRADSKRGWPRSGPAWLNQPRSSRK